MPCRHLLVQPGEGTTKGVFVTTSDSWVGVRDRVTYVIKSVDEDFFAEPEG